MKSPARESEAVKYLRERSDWNLTVKDMPEIKLHSIPPEMSIHKKSMKDWRIENHMATKRRRVAEKAEETDHLAKKRRLEQDRSNDDDNREDSLSTTSTSTIDYNDDGATATMPPKDDTACKGRLALPVGHEHYTISLDTIDYGTNDRNPEGFVSDTSPATSPAPTDKPASVVVTDAYLMGSTLRFRVDYVFRTWRPLGAMMKHKGGPEALDTFVKSDGFLRSNSEAGENAADHIGWKGFLLSTGSSATTVNSTQRAPWPMPTNLEQCSFKMVDMKLMKSEWIACLENRASAIVTQEHWNKNEELLEACAAFCEGKDDWTTLSA